MATRPPDWQIRPPRRRHRTLWSDLAGLWRRFRDLPILVQLIVGVLAVILVINLLSIMFGSDDGTEVASRSSTTAPTSSTAPTTTLAPGIPPGDDVAVRTVLDGDSFEIADGTKIRLIGMDAPDVETSACFSAEATNHLSTLVAPGQVIRLVYDTRRTDRFGRTLAYVYRIPDGLLLNVALVRDGYATHVTTGTLAPNPTYGPEIAGAEADARSARRGLWGACATATSSARSGATTATTAQTTTTTEAPTTTAPTTAAPTTTTGRGSAMGVAGATAVENQICFIPNATGVLADGRPAVCTVVDGYPRWRPA